MAIAADWWASNPDQLSGLQWTRNISSYLHQGKDVIVISNTEILLREIEDNDIEEAFFKLTETKSTEFSDINTESSESDNEEGPTINRPRTYIIPGSFPRMFEDTGFPTFSTSDNDSPKPSELETLEERVERNNEEMCEVFDKILNRMNQIEKEREDTKNS